MSIKLSDSIRVGQQKPVEDKYFNGLVPYTSTTQVNTLLPKAIRHIGLTVNINGEEYWYKGGIEDTNLVLKIPPLTKGMDSINITVWSENGNVFINGNISTTLVATVFKGKEDITDLIPSNRFNWIRKSANPAGDSVWNSLHTAKGKFINITEGDVSRSANFLVEIDIPEELLS